jgi:hypothetical protein
MTNLLNFMNFLQVKHARHVATLFLFSISLLFSNCDSALSDVEVTDPGALQPHFAVERAMLSDGTVLSALQTTILDKNLGVVELKNGQVKVNGHNMSLTKILNIPTYNIPSATVNLNTDYNFELVLANGSSYTGTVKTQEKTFTSVTVPSKGSVDSDLTVSWQDIYVHDDLVISLNLTSPAGTVPGATFTLTDEQMETGSFVIPKSNFATPTGITSVLITLTGAKYGTVDSKFRSGSTTISRMRVEKNVTFE